MPYEAYRVGVPTEAQKERRQAGYILICFMHYVYSLELSNQDIYVGFSGNLKQRLTAHNDGKVAATISFLLAKLKSYVAVETKEKAIALEKYFKTGSGRAFAKKRFW